MSGAIATMDELSQKGRRKQGRLKDAIQKRAQDSHYRALRRVTVLQDGDTVTLKGQVPTQFLKQVAQSIALEVAGPARVINAITVHSA